MEKTTIIEIPNNKLFLLMRIMKEIRENIVLQDEENILKKYRLGTQIEILDKIFKAKNIDKLIDNYNKEKEKILLIKKIYLEKEK